MKTLNSPYLPLADIPNQDNFNFIGLTKDGAESLYTVIKGQDGCYTLKYGLFPRLQSWRPLGKHEQGSFVVHEHTQDNLERFNHELEMQYEELFKNDPNYAFAASKTTPNALARKMTLGLLNGTAQKDGAGIKRVCAIFRVAYTYKAIREFLGGK